LSSGNSSALGERRAAAGLNRQYRVAAVKTYEALAARRLESVRIADPGAGVVDDFQIVTPGRLDAYQVKWSQYAQTFTVQRLLSTAGGKLPLVQQLAAGWQELRQRNPVHQVVVHLLSNDYAQHRGEDDSFALFLDQCWRRCTEELRRTGIPDACRATWEKLQLASGLAEDVFYDFAASCEIELGYRLPNSSEAGPLALTRDHLARERDLQDLARYFFDLAAAPTRPVERTYAELIRELGWQGRLELRHRHEFPDPTIPYQAVERTVRGLERALERLPGGYVLLVGTPGSGKSTLLTQTLRYRPERIVRYYAFVPDAPDRERGESAYFLHDLILMFEQQGIRASQSLAGLDRLLLVECLDAQLQVLHEEWRATGRKTIVVVDGLDHIAREQAPSRSLLADLPLPARVPDGVYFVLGSQTDQLPDLAPAVLSDLQQRERRIEMQPLEREAVLRIVSHTGFSFVPTMADCERIVELAGGHPLALAYLLNHLRQDGRESARVLADTAPFPGRIDGDYEAHWQQVRRDHELVKLLAMLARVRGGIDLPWIERWAPSGALYRLHSEFGYYFRREPPERLHFFHNSFQVFLLERTQRLPGVSSQAGDAGLYMQLAEAASADDGPWRWNEIFYRVKGGDRQRALELATLASFHTQFFGGRSWPDIRSDLALLLPLTVQGRDVEGLTRLLFIGMDIEQRVFNLNEYAACPIPELLAGLGETRAALGWARDGWKTHLKAPSALELAASLDRLGLSEEARKIFDLAEPLELLGGDLIPDHSLHDSQELLEKWVAVASGFRSIARLLEVISHLRCEENQFQHTSADEASRALQNVLKLGLLQTTNHQRRWADSSSIFASWDQEQDWEYWFWGRIYTAREASQEGERIFARSVVEGLVEAAAAQDLSAIERVGLAGCVLRILHDRDGTERLMRGVVLAPLSEGRGVGPLRAADIMHCFEWHRLLAVFGESRPVTELIPNAANTGRQALTYFERTLVIAARLWAAAWNGREIPGSEFALQASKAIRAVYRRHDLGRDTAWYEIETHRRMICVALIGAAQAHGEEAVEALRLVFEEEWARTGALTLWPVEVIRESARQLLVAGVPREWAVSWHERVGLFAAGEMDVPERLKQLAAQVRTWLDLGERERARKAYDELLQRSLGVHRKDPQLGSWIAWAEAANKEDPDSGGERLTLLASGLADVADKEVGNPASLLLNAAWKWDASAAKTLLDWMLGRGLIQFSNGLDVFVEGGIGGDRGTTQIALTLFSHVVLPLRSRAAPDLAAAVVRGVLQQGGDCDGLAWLVDRVLIAAPESARAGWIAGIQRGAEEGGLRWQRIARAVADEDALIRILEPPARASEADPRSSPLSEWEREEAEMRQRLGSARDLEGILARSPVSYLRLEKVLDAAIERWDKSDDLMFAARLIRDRARSENALNRIACRLIELGENEQAWEVGEWALNATRPAGWIWRLAERIRVETFSILRKCNRERASVLAFETLVGDLRRSEIGFASIAIEFHKIAPLLCDEVPYRPIWGLLVPYIRALFPATEAIELPDLARLGSAPKHPAAVLAGVVIELVDHPIADIAHEAQRIVIELLLQREAHLTEALRHGLGEGRPRMNLLTCLEAAVEVESQTLQPFLDPLQSLATSSHFGERIAAMGLLRRCGATVPPAPFRMLPAVYDLTFPEASAASGLREVEASEPLPETENPREVARIIRTELEGVSQLAGVDLETLYHRAAQLILDPAKPNVFSAEKILRQQLGDAGLRLPFRRPASGAARNALFTILGELIDAGRLSPPDTQGFPIYTDPVMLTIRPSSRPAVITPIPERSDNEGYPRTNWTEQVNLSSSALSPRASSGQAWIVLAEDTHLRWLDWSIPKERRMGAVVPSGALAQQDDGEILACSCCSWFGRAREYQRWEADSAHLIIRRNLFWLETPGSVCLALNPSVGRALGWRSAKGDWFRWRDASGDVMVESVWWQDGCLNLPPPMTNTEVGEGWLVRASHKGWQALANHILDLVALVGVEREAHEQRPRSVRGQLPGPEVR
jgi:hypothetical protein